MNEIKVVRKDIIASGNPRPVTFVDESEQVLNELPPTVRVKFNLICASKCKKFALEVAQAQLGPTRSKMFTRVSEDFLVACEANLKNFIHSRVRSHPSKGKTLT
jgi:hypothetical protein